MTLESSVLRDNAVRQLSDGYEIDVYLAWYRSLPISCVENVSITLGENAFDRESLRVLLNGKPYALDDLAAFTNREWFVQDPLVIKVSEPAPVSKGAEVDLSISLETRIPYIIIGPDKALVKRTDVNRKVKVQ